MKHSRTIKPKTSEYVFQGVNYVVLTLLTLLFLIPFLIVLSTSFVSSAEYARRGSLILFPQKIDFDAYRVLLTQGSILLNAYKITLFRVVVGTACNLLFTAMLAYGIAKKGIPGRNGIITMVFITMVFYGGLVPSYLLVKSLGLVDSVWSMVFPSLINAWWLIIMKNFFAQIPESLEESAFIDGANAGTVLLRIVVPLSMPIFATIGLFYAVWHWNSWFDASIYINGTTKLPIQVIMRNIVLSMSNQDLNQSVLADMATTPPPAATVRSAVIIVSTLPILLLYPFLQKYFVKGMIVGSLKG